MEADLVPERAADVLRNEAKLVDACAERRRHPDRADTGHLVVAVHRPLARAAVVLDEAARALERRGREAVEVQPLDLHDLVGLGDGALEVAPVEDALPHDVRAGVVMQDHLVSERGLTVDEGGQRLVVDLHEFRRIACELARRRDDGRDRLADVAHAPNRERVVLDVRAGRDGQLEERIGEDGDLVAGQRPVDAADLQRLRQVDRPDLRVRVRRADEVHVPHPVPLDVVEEHSLALYEPFVLLARDVRADEARLRLGLFDNKWLGNFGHFATARIASTMFT